MTSFSSQHWTSLPVSKRSSLNQSSFLLSGRPPQCNTGGWVECPAPVQFSGISVWPLGIQSAISTFCCCCFQRSRQKNNLCTKQETLAKNQCHLPTCVGRMLKRGWRWGRWNALHHLLLLFCSCLCSIIWVNDRTLLSVQIKRWRDDAGWMVSPSHLFIPHHAQPSFGLTMQTLHWDEGPQNHFPMFTRVTLPLLFFLFVNKFNLYNCTPLSFHL